MVRNIEVAYDSLIHVHSDFPRKGSKVHSGGTEMALAAMVAL